MGQTNIESETGSLNLDKLIKLMRLTGSDNDHEALAALRAASRLLRDSSWDWGSFLQGKVKVLADPFVSVPEPKRTPQRPSPPKAPPPPPPPPPPPRSRPNTFEGHCWCCGTFVPVNAGSIWRHNRAWKITCTLDSRLTAAGTPFPSKAAKKKIDKHAKPDLSIL